MNVFITGGGGFLGYRLALHLLERKTLMGADGKPAAISRIRLFDTAFPAKVDARVQCVKGDITDADVVEDALERDTASVFHLAAVVSAHAETEFDTGYSVNLDGTRNLLEA